MNYAGEYFLGKLLKQEEDQFLTQSLGENADSVKTAVKEGKYGLIDRETAIRRIRAYQLIQLMHPRFDKGQLKKAMELTRGVAASPGAASGHI